MRNQHLLLGHGGGGKLTAELIEDIFLPAFANPLLAPLNDQAVFKVGTARLAFTTDSFVVTPHFFPGGDIGSLAVHGTVNDLAMAGARPLYLSAGFILEEGFPIAQLKKVVVSMQQAAQAAGVVIATGDTKVVERGHGDGIYINTAGVGVVEHGHRLSIDQVRPGDVVLISGPIGDHGVAVLAGREGFECPTPVESDSAPLYELVATLLPNIAAVRCLRDPTRGGLASALNEIARASSVGIMLEERSIPVRPAVQGFCELLGLDPLYVACEGRLTAVVDAEHAERFLQSLHTHPLGAASVAIGRVVADHPGLVVMRTCIGGNRIVDLHSGEQLPRIC